MDSIDPGDIEERTVISEYEAEEFAGEGGVGSRVSVLKTTFAYVVELQLFPEDKTEYTLEKQYTPGQARELSSQLKDGDSGLNEKLGGEHTDMLVGELEFGADYASTRSIGEQVGEDVIEAYKEGKITEEELAKEFSTQITRGNGSHDDTPEK